MFLLQQYNEFLFNVRTDGRTDGHVGGCIKEFFVTQSHCLKSTFHMKQLQIDIII